MTQEMNCPACGAPVEILAGQDVIHCGFCGAQSQLINEGGESRFKVLSQPDPQKEVLSKPVEPASNAGQGAGFEPSETKPAEAGSQATPDLFSQPPAGEGGPVPIPGYRPAPESAPAYQAPPSASHGIFSGPNRWISIALIVLAVLCVSCVCLGGLAFALLKNSQ